QPSPAPSLMADMNGHVGRTRTRNQVGCSEHVEEIRGGNPAAPPNELLFHHRDMGCRTTEGGRAQSQERERDLLQLSAGNPASRSTRVGGTFCWRHQRVLLHLRTVWRTARGSWSSR